MKTLIMVALIATTVLAAEQEKKEPTFSDFDTNKNGKITKKEFKKRVHNTDNRTKFKNIDTNSDGIIDKKEFQHNEATKG